MSPTLEFIKTVLQKVSFDAQLFEKELRKGLKMLLKDDVKALKQWCYEKFGASLRTTLNRCFRKSVLPT